MFDGRRATRDLELVPRLLALGVRNFRVELLDDGGEESPALAEIVGWSSEASPSKFDYFVSRLSNVSETETSRKEWPSRQAALHRETPAHPRQQAWSRTPTQNKQTENNAGFLRSSPLSMVFLSSSAGFTRSRSVIPVGLATRLAWSATHHQLADDSRPPLQQMAAVVSPAPTEQRSNLSPG